MCTQSWGTEKRTENGLKNDYGQKKGYEGRKMKDVIDFFVQRFINNMSTENGY